MLGGVRRVDGEPGRGPRSANGPARGYGAGYGASRRDPAGRRDPYASPGAAAPAGRPGPSASPGPRGRHAPDDERPGRHLRQPGVGGADSGYGGHDDDDGDDDGPLLSRRGNPRRSRKQRVILGLLLAFVLVFLSAAGVAGFALRKYESIDRKDIDIVQAPPGEPENYLLVGSDNREGTADAGSVGGKRSDTIMILRVDPESDRLALTSFNRDLIVEIPATGETGMINSAFSLENGEQALIDTIKQNFGISINHYVEVDFQAFKQLVDAIGGVPLYFGNAVKDDSSGLFIEQLGCVTLQGEQALQFARARHIEYMTPDDGWEADPYADISRTQRQQVFIRRALAKALADVKANPLRVQQLIDIGVENVTLDDQMGVGDILDLAEHFQDFSSDRLETYSLPVIDHPTQSGRLLLDEAKAEPMLNVFRGLAPGEVSPGAVTVQVVNGTGKDGFANDVSGALQAVGFDLVEPTSTEERPAHSVVYHAPGEANFGQRVARHVTGGADLAERPGIESGHVELVVGADFTTVHDQPTPLDKLPTTTVPAAPGASAPPTTAVPPTTAPPTTQPPPTTTTTVANGYVVGEPPAGKHC
jgi:polyisoprenyl-teichoic acid--peptidoglycan teichoic acid transferase